ncbi:MAG: response regulator [Acidobacteria bacterium]|nr:response regulator [Acidobacteriota bacterium]
MPARILIADDYDDNRELLRLMVESAGHTVRETRDGRECLEAIALELPDVALLDLSMPVLDGWQVLAELRRDERTRSLPCVAVTAFASEQDRARALAAGFDAFISKPFRSKDLLEVIAALTSRDIGGGGDARSLALPPDALRAADEETIV